MTTRISIAQLNVIPGQPDKNFSKGVQAIQTAVENQSSIILLPELWTTGFDLERSSFHAQENQKLLKELQKMADEKRISIAGSYLLGSGKALFNSLVFLHPKQKPVIYRKIHLFPGMSESAYLKAGCRKRLLRLGEFIFGLAICFDLRFPDLFWSYSHSGANAFLLPSHWPFSRIQHWEILTRSRAVENQSYFIGCNTVGLINHEQFGGSSCVIYPDGTYACHAGAQNEELLTTELDPGQVSHMRTRIPIFKS